MLSTNHFHIYRNILLLSVDDLGSHAVHHSTPNIVGPIRRRSETPKIELFDRMGFVDGRYNGDICQ